MKNLRGFVQKNPKQKVEQSTETAQTRELYKEIAKLQAAVGKLEGEVFKPTDIIFGGTVTPMVNLLDNSDFSYSHRDSSLSTTRNSEVILGKWYTRPQGSEVSYVKNTNFGESPDAIFCKGALTKWESELDILEAETPNGPINYPDYPQGTTIRLIGEGKNKCIVGNGDVLLTNGTWKRNYLDNWRFPEIDEDKIYYIHSFYGIDDLENPNADKGYKISRTPTGTPLKVVNPSTGLEVDYIHKVTDYWKNPPPSSWQSGTLVDNDRFIRTTSTLTTYVYPPSGKPVWDVKRKMLKAAGGHVLASPLTARFVLLGNKLHFKMQIISAADSIKHIQVIGNDKRMIFVPQYEYSGIPGYYYKSLSPVNNTERGDYQRLLRPFPLWCTENTLVKGTLVRLANIYTINTNVIYEIVSSSSDYVEIYPLGLLGSNLAIDQISSNTLQCNSLPVSNDVTDGKFVQILGTSLSNTLVYEIINCTYTPIGDNRVKTNFQLCLSTDPSRAVVNVTAGPSAMSMLFVEPPTISREELFRRSPNAAGVEDAVLFQPLPKPGLKCKVSIWDNGGSAIYRGDKPVILASKVGSHQPDLVLAGIYKRDFTAYNSATQRYTTTFAPYAKVKENGMKIQDLANLSSVDRVFEIFEKNSPIPTPLTNNTTYKYVGTQTGIRIQSLSGSYIVPDNSSAPISFTAVKRVYEPEPQVKRDYILEVVMPDGRTFYSESEVFTEGKNSVSDTVNTSTVNSEDYVSITWSKVVGSKEYNIYRRVDGGQFYMIGSVPSSTDQFLDFGSATDIPLPSLTQRPPETEVFYAEAVITNVTDLIHQNPGVYREVVAPIQFPSAITQFDFSGEQYLQIEFFKPGEGLESTDLADIPVNTLGIDKVALGYNYGRWAPSDYDLTMKFSRTNPTDPIPNSVEADGTAVSSDTGFVAGSDVTQGGKGSEF